MLKQKTKFIEGPSLLTFPFLKEHDIFCELAREPEVIVKNPAIFRTSPIMQAIKGPGIYHE